MLKILFIYMFYIIFITFILEHIHSCLFSSSNYATRISKEISQWERAKWETDLSVKRR